MAYNNQSQGLGEPDPGTIVTVRVITKKRVKGKFNWDYKVTVLDGNDAGYGFACWPKNLFNVVSSGGAQQLVPLARGEEVLNRKIYVVQMELKWYSIKIKASRDYYRREGLSPPRVDQIVESPCPFVDEAQGGRQPYNPPSGGGNSSYSGSNNPNTSSNSQFRTAAQIPAASYTPTASAASGNSDLQKLIDLQKSTLEVLQDIYVKLMLIEGHIQLSQPAPPVFDEAPGERGADLIL